MKFDLTAAKAYVGGLFSTGGASVAAFLIGLFEKTTAIDLPPTIETLVVSGVAFIMGYIGVYFTSNKAPA